MRLSMWMIANRLNALEPEVHIKDDSPANLVSARIAVAPNCVRVYKDGKDVVCRSGDDYFVLHDIEFDYVFDVVQSIFDFYNEWSNSVQEAATDANFQQIIDDCWFLFNNPISMTDSSNRCLALSSQYLDTEVDEEWEYLSKNHFSSIDFVRRMRNSYQRVDLYQKNKPVYLDSRTVDIPFDTLSTAIYFQDYYCGRITIIAKEREINPGDTQVIKYLLNIMTPVMYMIQNQDDDEIHRPVFRDLILGKTSSKAIIKAQTDYLEWNMDDVFQVCTLRLPKAFNDRSGAAMMGNLIRRHSINAFVTIIDEEIVVIYNLKFMTKELLIETIQMVLVDKDKYQMGISSPMEGIYSLKMYYEQACAAIEYGSLLNPKDKVFYFYDYALYYIFENNDPDVIYHAMHPDVRYLDKLDHSENGEWVSLLKAFFDNECSLVNTAKALFVHRNTLVYRLNKLKDLMYYDLHEQYNRDYIKQSIMMLHFFRIKYGVNFGR
ncbi:MAG: helix-turn-helix domain-containing protein [Lachnospiraceae bacterium]|nr:helix-turn-helix domain-containing protein [Lachnospiraceae bacterium]